MEMTADPVYQSRQLLQLLYNTVAVVSETLFSEMYLMRVFSLCFSQLITKERPDEHCISTFR